MSSVGTLTGRHGKITVDDTLVARVTEWSLNHTMASTTEWGDSDSSGFTNRAAGRRDATADTSGKYDTDDEIWDLFKPGDNVQLVLWMDDPNLGGTGRYWDFPRALCTDFNLTVDIDTEEVIGWEASWGSDGVFTHPGQGDDATTAVDETQASRSLSASVT